MQLNDAPSDEASEPGGFSEVLRRSPPSERSAEKQSSSLPLFTRKTLRFFSRPLKTPPRFR